MKEFPFQIPNRPDFTHGQKRILAEFLANLTIAWLSITLISPIAQGAVKLPEILLSLLMAYLSLATSVYIAKDA